MFKGIKVEYNPMVEVKYGEFGSGSQEVVNLSLSELLEALKAQERLDYTKEYLLTLCYDGMNVNLAYTAGVYHLSDHVLEMEVIPTKRDSQINFETVGTVDRKCVYTYHVGVSRAMFEEYSYIFKGTWNKFLYASSGHVEAYKEIQLGKRAHHGYWSTMSEKEFDDIIRYIMLFTLDLDTRSKAIHLVYNDIRVIKIPPAVMTTRDVRLYDFVTSVYSDVEEWEMRSLVRGFKASDEMIHEMIQFILDRYNITITELKRKHFDETSPAAFRAVRSIKKAIAFYIQYEEAQND